MPDNKRVFISHISEEAALGAAVKAIIEEVFERDGVQAFLSSDMHDLPAGRNWLDEISKQLDQAQVMVSFISLTSLKRPWVNIELGAAWTKGLRVIPFCHSGQHFDQLPRPFQDSTGVDLDKNEAAQRLLGGVADGFGVAAPSTWLNFDAMMKKLRDAVAGIVHVDVEAEESALPELPVQQVRILQELAVFADDGLESVLLGQLADASEVKAAAFKHHLHELETRRLVHVHYFMHGQHEVSLQPEGAKWLINTGRMPG